MAKSSVDKDADLDSSLAMSPAMVKIMAFMTGAPPPMKVKMAESHVNRGGNVLGKAPKIGRKKIFKPKIYIRCEDMQGYLHTKT